MRTLSYFVDPPFWVIVLISLLILIAARMRVRKAQFYALVISSLVSLGIAEVACRFLNLGRSIQPAKWNEEFAKGQAYHYKPLGKLLYEYPDNPRGYFNEKNQVVGHVNAKGFRGPDTTFEKPDGITRFAFLGDSFTLGIGVKDDDTLPASFEQAMRSNYPKTEALNFGVSNSSTKHQIKLLERYVVKFDPDVVVIVLFLNDTNRLGTVRFLSRPMVLAKVRKYSCFANAIVGSVEKSLLHKTMIRHYQDGFKEGSSGWETVKAELRKGKSLSEEHGFRLVVAIYPVLIKLDHSYPFRDVHKTIDEYCKTLRIACVDLREGFDGKKDVDLWVHVTDQHPNEVAQKIAGEQLTGFFEDEELISE